VLTLLYKDERSKKLESFDILQNMFMGRVIKPADVEKFAKELLPHQKALTPEGYTVIEKATLEHNISVISKIYTNISFEELGRFLGIETERAERLIAGMVTEKRITA
jgi:COP9 signalosome complex subunit 4